MNFAESQLFCRTPRVTNSLSTGACFEPSHTYKMDLSRENSSLKITIFAKSSILDAYLCSEYTSEVEGALLPTDKNVIKVNDQNTKLNIVNVFQVNK